jgi:alkylation response protein AidB-like acyl-CoA dehydrogenase
VNAHSQTVTTPAERVGEQAARIAELAKTNMAEAFMEWAHVMAAHYLTISDREQPSEPLLKVQESLEQRSRLGSTAMAGAFKDVVGVAELPVTWREVGEQIQLDGPIAWASNLWDDAVMVTAARHFVTGQRIVVVVDVNHPGVTVSPITDLLALSETASGSLMLEQVVISTDQILHSDLSDFARRVRTRFLALQTSFCLGLSDAALRACSGECIQSAQGSYSPNVLTAVFADQHAALQSRLNRLNGELETVIEAITDLPASSAEITAAISLRLDAAVLARETTQLELCIMGGRGYVASSPTARRLREAMFLPVQSPTEGQLRWELTRSA